MSHSRSSIVFALVGAAYASTVALDPGMASADSIVLNPVKDNTLINRLRGEYSNGMGDAIYSGRTGPIAGDFELRGVVKFDLSAIPPGSVIADASLTLFQVSTVSGGQLESLHRMLADWGEGASNFPGGAGAPAEPGDATWNYRFYPSLPWISPGGDFDSAPSAATLCDFSGVDYVWTAPQMAADVQSWVDDPCGNFGWVLIGNEAEIYTAKRFASREWADDPAVRPRLAVTYVPATVCVGDVNRNGIVDIDDLVGLITTWGACTLACRCPADFDLGGSVNIDDLVTLITHWGACPAK